MKRVFLLLTILATFAINGYSQLVKVTATQRAGYNIDTTDFYLNPQFVQYIKKGTNPLVGYINPLKTTDTIITYKATQNFDTLINQFNRAMAYLIKLNNITFVSGTTRDTAIQWAYPINDFVEVKAKSYTPMPKINSTIALKQNVKPGYTRLDIGETNLQIKTRVDSLIRVAKNLTY